MQNDSIFCHWDGIIQTHNWQDSVPAVITVVDSHHYSAESQPINLDLILSCLFVYAIVMSIILFVPYGKIIHRKDKTIQG